VSVWILSPQKAQLSRDNLVVLVDGAASGVAIGRRILRRVSELVGSGEVVCPEAAELACCHTRDVRGNSRHEGRAQTRRVGCATAAKSRPRRRVLVQMVASRCRERCLQLCISNDATVQQVHVRDHGIEQHVGVNALTGSDRRREQQ